jgi:hypothetical protein
VDETISRLMAMMKSLASGAWPLRRGGLAAIYSYQRRLSNKVKLWQLKCVREAL